MTKNQIKALIGVTEGVQLRDKLAQKLLMQNNYKGCIYDLGSKRILADQGRQHVSDVNGGEKGPQR